MRFENGRSNQDLEETSKNGVNLDMDNREGVPFSNGNGHLRSTSTNGNTTHKSGDASSTSSWHGHKREEVTRLIIQSLYDLGYTSSAEQLENESQCALESSEVATFRRAILNGQWATAENLLGSLDVQPHANMNELLFALRQQKFLELLEAKELSRALHVLRLELTPLTENTGVERLHLLSSLIMLSPTDIKTRAGWDGASGTSRQDLLRDLSNSVSPNVMIPEHRLATLLQQVKNNQVSQCLYHNTANSPSLYTDHICDRSQFPLATVEILQDHNDEVWYVQFSHDGSKLATASKDKKAIIWNVETFEPLHILSDHTGAVAYVQWSPDDTKLLTCGHDKTARLWDVQTGRTLHILQPHGDSVSSCAWAPDGQSFVTGGMDKDMIVYNLKGVSLHKWTGSRIYDMAITPDGSRLVAICTERKIHIYDYIKRTKESEIPRDYALTSISVSRDSRYFMVNLANQEVELWDMITMELVRKFKGQKQGEFVIKSCFGGADENFVVSGSEDGHICVWHKENGILMERLSGHEGTVNCVAWNPTNPHMFASAGDDHEVRIWSLLSEPHESKGKEREPLESLDS